MEQGDTKPAEQSAAENIETPKQKVVFVDDYLENSEMAWMEFKMDNPQLAGQFEAAYISSAKDLTNAVEKIMKINPTIIFMDNDLKGEFGGPDGPDVAKALSGAGFAGIMVGNSSSGAAPFEKKGVADLMNGGFLADKNVGIKEVLEKLLKK